MTQSVREFLAKVRSDEQLKSRFQKLWQAGDLPGLKAMGEELGYHFTREDYDAAVHEDLNKLKDEGHLSDDDLQAVAGGASGSDVGIKTLSQTCDQLTMGMTCGPSVGTPMCSEVTCA